MSPGVSSKITSALSVQQQFWPHGGVVRNDTKEQQAVDFFSFFKYTSLPLGVSQVKQEAFKWFERSQLNRQTYQF